MPTQLSDAAVYVNDEVVPIVPNTLAYTEGFGEQSVLPMSVGDGQVENVVANNLETANSKVSFQIRTIPELISLVRSWKANPGTNVVQLAGSTPEGSVRRTFTQATLTSDYEVRIGSEETIEIEFMGNKAF